MSKDFSVNCHECDHEFNVESMQSCGTVIECPSCGNCHEVDTDYGDDGETFWYLNSV